MSARSAHSPLPDGFPIGMQLPDMALIEVRHHGFRQRAGMFGLIDKFRVDRLAHQNRDAGAPGVHNPGRARCPVMFAPIMEQVSDRSGQSVGVIEFIDIGDIAIALFCGFGVADIVNTKSPGFSSDC